MKIEMEKLKNILSKENVITNIAELDKNKFYLFYIKQECFLMTDLIISLKDLLDKNGIKYILVGDGLISSIYKLDPEEDIKCTECEKDEV